MIANEFRDSVGRSASLLKSIPKMSWTPVVCGLQTGMAFRRSRIVNSIVSALIAALIGGAVSYLLLLSLYPRVWRMNGHLFLIYLTLHAVLMVLLLVPCGLFELNLHSISGIGKSLGVAVVGSLLVIVLGGYPAIGLLYTGLAFTTSFGATLVYTILGSRSRSRM
jgi:hypothetical protein